MGTLRSPYDTFLTLARLLAAVAVLLSSLSFLLHWHWQGWTTPLSVIAQLAEAVGCVVLLWRPWRGLVLLAIPMAVTLIWGTHDADLMLSLLVPAVFVASFRGTRAWVVAVAMIGYSVAREVTDHSFGEFELLVSYLVRTVMSVLVGLVLRWLIASRRRGAVKVAVLTDDVRSVRADERIALANDLRSVVMVRLAEAWQVLQAVRTSTDAAEMRHASLRISQACTKALGEVRTLVGMLREDPTASGTDESVAEGGADGRIEQACAKLRAAGATVTLELGLDPGSLPPVTRTTLLRVLEAVVEATVVSDPATAAVHLHIAGRFGGLQMAARYPSRLLPEPELEERFERLQKRAQALGGSLTIQTGDGRHLILKLPPDRSAALPLERSSDKISWHRRILSANRPRLVVTALAAALALPPISVPGTPGLGEWSLLRAAAFSSLALVVWRPALGLILAGVASVGMLATAEGEHPLILLVAVLAASYGATGLRRTWIPIALAVAGPLLSVAAAGFGLANQVEFAVLALGTMIGAPSFLAARHFVRSRSHQLGAIAQLEGQERNVRTEERNLLARELHDVVAHQLSRVALQHMAYGDSEDPAELRLALDRMEEATSSAESEMELLTSIMADDGGAERDTIVRPTAVATTLSQTLRDNGFTVVAAVDAASDELSPAVQRTLTRVMQEGATNILRYGKPQSECHLTLTANDHEAVLEVVNEMPGSVRQFPMSLGYGLLGVRERVDLSGGQFQAGPDGSDWIVRVALPLNT